MLVTIGSLSCRCEAGGKEFAIGPLSIRRVVEVWGFVYKLCAASPFQLFALLTSVVPCCAKRTQLESRSSGLEKSAERRHIIRTERPFNFKYIATLWSAVKRWDPRYFKFVMALKIRTRSTVPQLSPAASFPQPPAFPSRQRVLLQRRSFRSTEWFLTLLQLCSDSLCWWLRVIVRWCLGDLKGTQSYAGSKYSSITKPDAVCQKVKTMGRRGIWQTWFELIRRSRRQNLASGLSEKRNNTIDERRRTQMKDDRQDDRNQIGAATLKIRMQIGPLKILDLFPRYIIFEAAFWRFLTKMAWMNAAWCFL